MLVVVIRRSTVVGVRFAASIVIRLSEGSTGAGEPGRELRLHEIRHDVAFVIDGDPDHKVNRIGFQLGSRQLEVAFLAKCHYGLIGRESVGVIQLYDFGKGALHLGGRIHALLRDFALFEVVAVIILLLVAGQHVDRYARAVYAACGSRTSCRWSPPTRC